jgi:hypothetical protein
MYRLLSSVWTALITVFLLGVPQGVPSTSGVKQAVPPDFYLVDSAKGVDLYQKDYQPGNPDFVQVVNLEQGASVKLLHGSIADLGIGQGVYGGDNPMIERQSLQEVWSDFKTSFPDAFCITNGQFFSTNDDPTKLAFPLKKDGKVLSDGYGISEYPNQKLMLEIWGDRVGIQTLTKEALYASSAPDIIAGLTEDANKSPDEYVGRTFVGIDDADRDGNYETVLIFNSLTSRQGDAAGILRGFGAERIIMLDGGGSTQLTCKDTSYVSSSREIPQTLATVSSPAPAFYASTAREPVFPILIEGESLGVEIELMNTGTDTWRTGECQFRNIKNPWGAGEWLPLPMEVKSGESVEFSWITEIFSSRGIFSTEWNMACGGNMFSSEPVQFTVIVIPQQLEEKKAELEALIQEWTQEQLGNIEILISQWIQEQIENIGQSILEWIQEQVNSLITGVCCPSTAMIPLGLLLAARSRVRRREANRKFRN